MASASVGSFLLRNIHFRDVLFVKRLVPRVGHPIEEGLRRIAHGFNRGIDERSPSPNRFSGFMKYAKTDFRAERFEGGLIRAWVLEMVETIWDQLFSP